MAGILAYEHVLSGTGARREEKSTQQLGAPRYALLRLQHSVTNISTKIAGPTFVRGAGVFAAHWHTLLPGMQTSTDKRRNERLLVSSPLLV